jgi:hypothetical protein
MASTRNKNTKGDYNLEQKQYQHSMDHLVYKHFGAPVQTNLPGNGLLAGKVGSMELSNNFADVESSLRGIGSTNLVNPQPEIRPQIKTLDSLSICDRLTVHVPEPLVIEKNQRPMYLN